MQVFPWLCHSMCNFSSTCLYITAMLFDMSYKNIENIKVTYIYFKLLVMEHIFSFSAPISTLKAPWNRETEYLSGAHLQEGFKSNPLHLILQLKSRQGLGFSKIWSCREKWSYGGLLAPSPVVRSGGGRGRGEWILKKIHLKTDFLYIYLACNKSSMNN